METFHGEAALEAMSDFVVHVHAMVNKVTIERDGYEVNALFELVPEFPQSRPYVRARVELRKLVNFDFAWFGSNDREFYRITESNICAVAEGFYFALSPYDWRVKAPDDRDGDVFTARELVVSVETS